MPDRFKELSWALPNIVAVDRAVQAVRSRDDICVWTIVRAVVVEKELMSSEVAATWCISTIIAFTPVVFITVAKGIWERNSWLRLFMPLQ